MYKQIIIYKYNSGRNILTNPKKIKKIAPDQETLKWNLITAFVKSWTKTMKVLLLEGNIITGFCFHTILGLLRS